MYTSSQSSESSHLPVTLTVCILYKVNMLAWLQLVLAEPSHTGPADDTIHCEPRH